MLFLSRSTKHPISSFRIFISNFFSDVNVVDNSASPITIRSDSPLPMVNFSFPKLALTSPKRTSHSYPKITSTLSKSKRILVECSTLVTPKLILCIFLDNVCCDHLLPPPHKDGSLQPITHIYTQLLER